MATKVISIMNSKGGVGKTITAANMAQILASEYGMHVLAIDLDPQADLTALLGTPTPMGDHWELDSIAGAYDLLTGAEAYPENMIYPTRYSGLDLVPSCSQMLVLVTMWHNSEACKQGLIVLEDALPENVLLYPAMIRRSDKVDESTYYGQALGEYSRYSSAGRDYRDFVAQFLSVTIDGTLESTGWGVAPSGI